jgi:hypothetical protein
LTGVVSAPSAYSATACVSDGLDGHEVCREVGVSVNCPAPSVTLDEPADGSSTFSCPVTLSATASSPSAVKINSVAFYDGSTLILTVKQPPYSMSWSPPTCCSHQISARATNACGGVAASNTAAVNIFCYGAFSLNAAGRGVKKLSLSSQLDVPGARGQVVVNDKSVVFPGAGRSHLIANGRAGVNRVEARLVEASGQPGTWRFDLTSGVEPGSVRVVSGDVALITADAVAFRMKGKAGERVSFTYKTKE